MTRDPRVRRMVPLRRLTQPPPADPWSDTAVVAWAIVVLLLIVVLSSVVPLTPVVTP